jgi:hypothetical protein
VLDAHGIAWLYEPHTFVLERDPDGSTRRAFTPDFFLPEIGLYLECTVARRRLTTRKRQKVRAVRRLHGVLVEIVYRTDFEALARRWGLADLERALRASPPGEGGWAAAGPGSDGRARDGTPGRRGS